MNSLNDKDFDGQLDRLLTKSVAPGSEPAGFTVGPMPPKPKFNWFLVGGLAACIGLAFVLMFKWITGLSSAGAEAAMPGRELWQLLSDTINAGAGSLSSTTFLLYAAAVMATVYVIVANRIIRLYRYH